MLFMLYSMPSQKTLYDTCKICSTTIRYILLYKVGWTGILKIKIEIKYVN